MTYRKPTKAVVTDAGFASRFLPITKTIPKAMLPMGAKPIMQLVIEECVAAGIKEIILVATKKGKPIYEDYFHDAADSIRELMESQGKSKRFEPVTEVLQLPKITIIEQDANLPYGNGSPIASAKPYIDDDEAFVAVFSDDVVFGSSDVETLLKSYDQHPEAGAIIVAQETPREVLNRYGVIRLKDKPKMLLHDIVEKPKVEDAPSNLVSYGRYLLTPKVFEYLAPKNVGRDQELWIVDAITKIAKQDDVYVVKTEGQWMTTGDPQNYLDALAKYKEMQSGD